MGQSFLAKTLAGISGQKKHPSGAKSPVIFQVFCGTTEVVP
jgi:hypothetical protein